MSPKIFRATISAVWLGLAAAVAAAGMTLDVPPVSFPTIASSAQDAEGFVPTGWVLLDRKDGDLNGDGKADLALLLRMADATNVVRYPYGDPGETWDTNPYMLAVAFADPGGGYRLAASNHAIFYRPDSPGSGDMPPDENTLAIERGSLVVFFEYLRDHESFRFRWDGQAFALIGFDSGGASGNCVETTSINYLSGKATMTSEPMDRDGLVTRNFDYRPAGLPNLSAFDKGEFTQNDPSSGSPPHCPA